MLYYFSDENLARDEYLRSLQDADGYVSLNEFLDGGFKKVTELGATIQDLQDALRYSYILALSKCGTKVRRRFPPTKLIPKVQLQAASLYVKTFPTDDPTITSMFLENWFREKLAAMPVPVNIQSVRLLRNQPSNEFNGSIIVVLGSAEEVAEVVKWTSTNPLYFEKTPLTVEALSDHKKTKKPTTAGPPALIPNPWKPDKLYVLTEEALKLLEELRKYYKDKVIINSVNEKEEKQSQFSCRIEYTIKGETYTASTPAGHPHRRKADAKRFVEWHVYLHVHKLEGNSVPDGAEITAADCLRNNTITEYRDKLSRRSELARIKRLFSFYDPETVENIIASASNMEEALRNIGNYTMRQHIQQLEDIYQKHDWMSGIKALQEQLNERRSTISTSEANLASSNGAPILDSEGGEIEPDDLQSKIIEELATINVSQIELGYLRAPREFVVLWKTGCETKISYDEQRPYLCLTFSRHTVQYKIKNILKELLEPLTAEADFMSESPSYCAITVPLAKAPCLMKKPMNYQSWLRSLDFTPNKAWNDSTMLRLYFEKEEFEEAKIKLAWILLSLAKVGLLQMNLDPTTFYTRHEPEPYTIPSNISELAPEVRFKIECIVSRHIIIPAEVTEEFVSLLTPLSPGVACKALHLLESKGKRVFNPTEVLKELIAKTKLTFKEPKDTDTHFVLIPHVVFTPLRMWCEGPVAEISNRVIRSFPHAKHRFVRVGFKEEDGKTSIKGVGKSAIKDRVGNILNNGFELPFYGYKFSFFVFSSGQLRGHKSWFFAEGPDLTCASLRQWMGDFRKIFNVAMYSSRLGQALSSTYPTIDVPHSMVEIIPDVKRNGFVFSDGVGTISMSLARKIAEKLPLKDKNTVPSCYQIRWAGAKGVISVDPRLEGDKMRIRPSMNKFECPHTNVEVVTWAKPIPAHLNKQVIIILSALGVEDEKFMELQREALEKLESIQTSSLSTAKEIELLESTWRAKNVSESLPGRAIRMLRSGFDMTKEPYLQSILRVINLRRLQDLRVMARIPIENGQYAIGVMDEFGILNYGEVFYRRSLGDGKYEVMTGPLVISRSPSLHPGDVRILQGVDIPELYVYNDCLVFPQKGERPHPHECSGGDLDGDQYLIIWDPRLQPKITDTPPSSSHETTANSIRSKDDNAVTDDELKEFFVDYIYNDKLGQIADAHMYHADKSPLGVFDPICLKLAELHNIAVDSPKTGKTVPQLDEMNPPEYPDFMDMPFANTYASQKVLGKLYRNADSHVRLLQLLCKRNQYDNVLEVDPDLVYPGWEEYIEEAKALRDAYSQDISIIMHQYNLRDEFQAITGDIVWDTAGQRREWQGLRDGFEKFLKYTTTRYRNIFFSRTKSDDVEDAVQLDDVIDVETQMKRASAWYIATYDRKYHNESVDVKISFPWVVDDVLCSMKERRRAQRQLAEEQKESATPGQKPEEVMSQQSDNSMGRKEESNVDSATAASPSSNESAPAGNSSSTDTLETENQGAPAVTVAAGSGV